MGNQEMTVLITSSAKNYETLPPQVEVYATREAAQEAMRQMIDSENGLRQKATEEGLEVKETDNGKCTTFRAYNHCIPMKHNYCVSMMSCGCLKEAWLVLISNSYDYGTIQPDYADLYSSENDARKAFYSLVEGKNGLRKYAKYLHFETEEDDNYFMTWPKGMYMETYDRVEIVKCEVKSKRSTAMENKNYYIALCDRRGNEVQMKIGGVPVDNHWYGISEDMMFGLCHGYLRGYGRRTAQCLAYELNEDGSRGKLVKTVGFYVHN